MSEVQPYVNAVPLVDLKFAAGLFTESSAIDPDEIEWVQLPGYLRPRRDLFVAQVLGESMNRRIRNGEWCLFQLNPRGTRQGKIVIAQHKLISDPEGGGSFTVKHYESKKAERADGSWEHDWIRLSPISDSSDFSPMQLEGKEADELKVVAEFVLVLDKPFES